MKIKIILLEKIVNLGDLGDVVEVSAGYARNFLVPFGKAIRATAKNLEKFKTMIDEYKQKQKDILTKAQERCAQIHEQIFEITAKSGVDGKLFGSVTSLDIVNAINKKVANADIKKSEVSLPNGTLKSIGEFDVTVILHSEVKAAVKINVTPEASS